MRVRLLPVLSPMIGGSMVIAGCQAPLPVTSNPEALTIKNTVSSPTIPSVTRSKLMPLEQTLAAFGINLLKRISGNGLSKGPTGFSWQQPNKLNDMIGGPAPHVPGMGSTGSRPGMGFGSPMGGAEPALPGWGSGGWGPGAQLDLGQGMGSTWGQSVAPGMFNLSRGAGQIGGFGLDSGFFTIPQDEISRQIRAQMDSIDQNRGGTQGTTGLDPKKFPFLHPVQGPLIPPGKS